MLEFFDCNCEFGPYRTKVYRYAATVGELLEEMELCHIGRALVFHTSMRFDSPVVGNRRILEETRDHPRLVPAWSVLPSHTGEMRTGEDLLDDMRENGVRALWLFPNDHRYFLDEMTWGDQVAMFEERHIPLFIKARVDLIAQLLQAFKNLTVITGTHGFNPLDRYAWPLFENFPNLICETSCYLTDGAIEEFCKRFGAGRLVFGSGYPANAKGSAVLRLKHADISEAERSSIASGNLDRILEGARME